MKKTILMAIILMFVFPLILQAQRQWIHHEVHFSKIPKEYRSKGDADVYTKKGKNVTVRVIAGPIENWKDRLIVNVIVQIREGTKDYTFLEKSEKVTIMAPKGFEFVTYPGSQDWCDKGFRKPTMKTMDVTKTITGENHGWIDFQDSLSIGKTPFSSLKVRIDGKGRDDRGNAQLKGTLSINAVCEWKK